MSRPSYMQLGPGRPTSSAGTAQKDEESESSFLHPFALEPPTAPHEVPRPGRWDQGGWFIQRWKPVVIVTGLLLLAGALALTLVLAGSRISKQQPSLPGQPLGSEAAGTQVGPASTQPSPSSNQELPGSTQLPPSSSQQTPTSPSDQASPSSTDLPPTFLCPEPPSTASDIVFFIVGDWGRSGSVTQTKVADMMAQVASCMHPRFVVSTGDNFYPSGLNSPAGMRSSFTDVYTAPSLQVPWYAVLGNHDYGDDLDSDLLRGCHQLGTSSLSLEQQLLDCQRANRNGGGSSCCYSPLWQDQVQHSSLLSSAGAMDPRWNLQQGAWQVKFSPELTITFIDTSPHITEYRKKHWARLLGGITARSDKVVLSEQTTLIDRLLQQGSGTALNLVVGHHPIHSSGNKCHGKDKDKQECADMADWLSPLLRKHKVPFYISGHEHDLQYIRHHGSDSPTHYIISGAGSDVDAERQDNPKHNIGAIFHDQGFVAAVVRGRHITLYYYLHSAPQPVFNITLG